MSKKTKFIGARVAPEVSISLQEKATYLGLSASEVIATAVTRFCASDFGLSSMRNEDQFRRRAEVVVALGAIASDARKAGGLFALAVKRANGVDVGGMETGRARILALAEEASEAIRTLLDEA
ncbi:hypothetical protein [Rhodoblastus sp.]|jgi:hypothetical protein|uniref:hypothetical protein n=1 Tax=Rhodoblastus sp. TaxID=1962975 RepID=UPI0025D8B562|nr:hypothetical protein [Rhodoblastus sp.]